MAGQDGEETGCRWEHHLLVLCTRQAQHHATRSAAGNGWRAGDGELLQAALLEAQLPMAGAV